MIKPRESIQFALTPEDNERLASLCGEYDQHLRQVESYLGVEINNRGFDFEVIGTVHSAKKTEEALNKIYQEADQEKRLSPEMVHLVLQSIGAEKIHKRFRHDLDEITLKTPQMTIKPRSPNQFYYVRNILTHDVNFSIGPSGTGKTYLAVACAVAALVKEDVRRIILVRPAVEAGEKLGFLPGDIAQKIDPYLRPLYDALYEMLGVDRVPKMIEKGVIEVAPLAFMRGRTLNDAFIILDESQNTTSEQMKMFLTRIGFSSKSIITGDITQTDLPDPSKSGLRHAIQLLKDIDEISFSFFQSHDVVRHPLVQQIVRAYEKNESHR